MKKYFLFLVIVTLLVTIGCGEDKEKKTEKTVPVKVYKVKNDRIENAIKVTGSISAGEDVIVFAKVSERVERIFVKPGDRVTQGQTLAVQYNAIFKQGVEAAESAVKSALIQAKLVAQDYDRMKTLFDQKAISQQQFDQIKTQNESLQLMLDQSKVQLKLAKEQYDNSFIKAPFSGVAASVFVEANQMTAAGTPIVQVINPKNMKAKIKIPSSDIKGIFKGQNVKINFPSVPEKSYFGTITQIDQAVDQFSKNLQIEVLIKSPDNMIKSGMFGEFLIETDIKENSIVIPESAIQNRTEVKIDRETGLQNSIRKSFVFIVKNDAAQLAEVKTGIVNDGRIEVLSGLSRGDVVIVVGQNIVKAGEKVKIID
jgi:RND family efflux transporter MFP subunit